MFILAYVWLWMLWCTFWAQEFSFNWDVNFEPCGIVMGLKFPFPFWSNGGELCSNKQCGIDAQGERTSCNLTIKI